MKINKDFIFKTSISKDRYINKEISGAMIASCKVLTVKDIRKKYGFKRNVGVGYMESEETAETLLNKLLNGAVMCNLFSPYRCRKDGTFGSSEKRDRNFKGSFTIGVDIDHTSYQSVEDYINKLTFKPTFYYTSYSNEQPNKGIRFRMIYVFDDLIKNKYFFRYAAYQVHKAVEKDTDELIDDYCGIKCSQYFNGTNINTEGLIVKYGLTNNIYSLSDFNITKEGYIDFVEHNCYYKTHDKRRERYFRSILDNYYRSNIIIHQEGENAADVKKTALKSNPSFRLQNDMARLPYEEFMKYNRHKYRYYYRVEKGEWINNAFQFVDDDYFALYYNVTTVKDGSQRRKKLYQRMCLRRVMNPDVDADTLLFNAYEDVHKFFEVDKDLTIECLAKNVEWAMNKDIEDIKIDFSDTISYLKSKGPKKGIIYKNRAARSRQNTYALLDSYYNKDLSVVDNIIAIYNIYGYEVKKSTIYAYLNDRNIKDIKNTKNQNDDLILSVYDPTISLRKNHQYINEHICKVSLGKLSKLINKVTKESQINNIEVIEDNKTDDIEDNEEVKKDDNNTLNFYILDLYYDSNISVKDNITNIYNIYGYDINEDTVKTYIDDKNQKKQDDILYKVSFLSKRYDELDNRCRNKYNNILDNISNIINSTSTSINIAVI